MRPIGNGRSRSGFTLVEVLISLTLLATIMAILWGTFANAHRMRDLVTEKTERTRGVQAALRRMQREISMAFVTKIGEIPTNEAGIVTYQTAFIGDDDRLDFTNFAHVRTRVGQAASEQAEISYYLRPGEREDGRITRDLVRREQAPIDGDPEEGGTIYVLLEDVKDIEFEYWDPEAEMAEFAWGPDWDTRDTGVVGLPSRVRITVDVQHPIRERETLTYSVMAEVHLNEPIGFATNVIVPMNELLQEELEQEMRRRDVEDVVSPQSDDFDGNPFGNRDPR